MDISRIKEDTELTVANTGGFHVGDHIVIQEKVDGSNSAIVYDKETNKLVAFSRRQALDYNNTLNGFWNWVQTLAVKPFSKYPNYVFFGEWLTSHTIKYIQDAYKKFYFYDVYDKENECYLPQSEAKRLADELNLRYVQTFYDGEFVSWEHCMSFMHKSDIAVDVPEGCFDFRTKILMGDGTEKKINQIQVGDIVKSYNINTNKIENQRVANVFYNGKKPLNQWNSIAVFPKGTSGNSSITGRFCCTKNHKFYDGNGYTRIDELDYVYHYGIVFDEIRKQMFLGLLVSDMCYCKNEKTFRLNQVVNRSNDFISIFEPFLSKSRKVSLSGKGSDIINLWFKKQHIVSFVEDYIINDKINFKKVFNELNIIGWTFFFIGDGCGLENGKIKLSFASNTDEEVDVAVSCINNIFGVKGSIYIDKRVMNGSGKSYEIPRIDGRKMMRIMSKYVPNDFRYKIRAIEDKEDFIELPEIAYGLTKRNIFSKKEMNELSNYNNRNNINAFDLEVENNHNYFANGCLVHNCVVKNQTEFNNPNSRTPFVLKIVNSQFSEIKKDNHRQKVEDPQKLAAKAKASDIVEQIVTKNRVQKELHKMIDEGILSEKIEPQDMKIVAQNLPKRIFEDCVKEENELVVEAGEFFGKMCGSTTMNWARKIIFGE